MSDRRKFVTAPCTRPGKGQAGFRDNEVQSQYCLGWRKLTVKTINKSTLIFHSGYINGATAFVGIIPEHKVGIVILANQSSRFPLKNGLKLWKNIIESNNSTNNG